MSTLVLSMTAPLKGKAASELWTVTQCQDALQFTEMARLLQTRTHKCAPLEIKRLEILLPCKDKDLTTACPSFVG